MKHFAITVISILIFTSAFAKCGSHGIYSFTNSASFSKNGLIILEFYGSSQDLIKDLNTKYPIYLQNSQTKVTLEVFEILKGQFRQTQVVLKPKVELLLNESYTLQMENLPKYETKPSLTFKVVNDIDNVPPVFNGKPVETRKSFVGYGCGPAIWIYYDFSGQVEKDCFVRTTLKNKKTGLTTTYILKMYDGTVKIGHDMCSGAFAFDDKVDYEASFQLIDQAGNLSIAKKTVIFSKPTKETLF
jgi:hypothetical protein